ncbi:hypothetical protein P4637_01285 [Halalkalibacterium halodurans]|uniref:BH1773 protein n=1 Tax=Halalkalibacterium halodurans (strain ATCC BAA-125 / DSM 18197 / FERM 7344 / JCM 9153 / C-125) TaxID=272558 RepID=Q9KC01_HALH5|nr:hypothetical protein [Halalkalibacterium halodurans]MDY7222333.1 hypothetical protein [Halalkalibacterium halodurans]MDY7241554.1 hypothetical protein [Halalkalibacterium halodurans]MED4082360.1 hypothetical protein [Halalkalibacterium halodurans]MED4083489.1 hypothetical protein [Halalkalibacterium halodurans]MED4105802.1 hypothetical protein [Halalkalibacterium halodurans]
MLVRRNQVAKLLLYFCYVILGVAFIGGLTLGLAHDIYYSFSFLITWDYWVKGALLAGLFLFFSELIEQMHIRNFGSEQIKNTPENPLTPEPGTKNESKFPISEQDRQSVYEFYAEKGEEVEDIVSTPVKDVCLVKIGGELRPVEIGDFKPIERSIKEYPELRQWYDQHQK